MLPFRQRSSAALRLAIDCLPVATRLAMLDGVQGNPIIVGAYVDRDGGVCPMLAAHRNGGRTDFVTFARAWDEYTHAKRVRPATERELEVLVAHLRASLAAEEPTPQLAAAVEEHRELVARRRAAQRGRSDERDRSDELAERLGWSWLRPFRRLDEFERALAQAEAQSAELEAQRAGAAAPERAPTSS